MTVYLPHKVPHWTEQRKWKLSLQDWRDQSRQNQAREDSGSECTGTSEIRRCETENRGLLKVCIIESDSDSFLYWGE